MNRPWNDPLPDGAQVVTEGFDPIATSGTETYVITVDNVGTQDVTGIRVRDTLPADTQFLSVVADATHWLHLLARRLGDRRHRGVHRRPSARDRERVLRPRRACRLPGPGDDIATIKIKVFARHTVGTMHNEVRVDPLNEIAEYNELNNLETEDTTVTNGGCCAQRLQRAEDREGADQPRAAGPIGRHQRYVEVQADRHERRNRSGGERPCPRHPAAGSRFIEAVDTEPGPDGFHCSYAAGVIACVGGPLDGALDLLGVLGSSRPGDQHHRLCAPTRPASYSNQADRRPGQRHPRGRRVQQQLDHRDEGTGRPATAARTRSTS